MSDEFHVSLAEVLIPKLFDMYKQNIAKQFRVRCIGLIDKVITVLPDEIVEQHIHPDALA